MTQRSLPHSNTPIATEAEWANLARHWYSTGIIAGELNQFANNAPSGLNIEIQSGRAFVDGVWYESDDTETITVGTNTGSGSARTDRIALKLDRTTKTVEIIVIPGTPGAGTPAMPANTSTEVYSRLYRVTLNGSSGSINTVTDERIFAQPHRNATTDRAEFQTEVAAGQYAIGLAGSAVVMGDFGQGPASAEIQAISSGSNCNLVIKAKGTGTGSNSAVIFADHNGVSMGYFASPWGLNNNETTLVIMRQQGSTHSLQRVTEGAIDSGGTGYRLLRIAN